MAYITPAMLSLKTCFQSQYSLPYFQRDYKWESRHFLEMLNDIQSAFVLSYDEVHGRRDVATYAPYFLGSIITSSENGGKKPLIDGQQRVTSLFIILAFLSRYVNDNNVTDSMDLKNFIGSTLYGAMDYNIEFSEERKKLFDIYLDFTKPLDTALNEIDSINNITDSDRRIIDAIESIEGSLDSIVKEKISFFIDYLMEKVLLIEIAVSSESEAHRVFVTMNDRGLRLGAIELLKGYILSRISNSSDSQQCHLKWVKTMASLRESDPEGDSVFIKNFLRAKWGDSIRGKSKGDEPGDFDTIGFAYHRWFENHANSIGLKNSDDFFKFANDTIPYYAELSNEIANAEKNFTADYPEVYYNSSRRFSLQTMILLSSITESDTREDRRKKIQLISKFIDLILTSRTLDKKVNNYDNLKETAFSITKEVRNKSYAELSAYISREWGKYYPLINKIVTFAYQDKNRSEMLFLLGRIAHFLEVNLNTTNKVGFDTYLQRDKGQKTFDIEHILRSVINHDELPSASLKFTSDEEYLVKRNVIGGLILLPRSRNRSLSDNTYADKKSVYAIENILCQTLCEGFYQNNPELTRFLAAFPTIPLKKYDEFESISIDERGELYKNIALKIWETPITDPAETSETDEVLGSN
ncbi:TPA: DUF262 domain-containing protein [Enterobacter ludwigii]|nr:DUF262 domain-containing protein [Enterobacter ludwigii]